MELIMGNQNFQLDHAQIGVHDVFDRINDFLVKETLFFSHLVIDGEEVYGDPEDYIQEHLSTIRKVEVKTLTVMEFVGELLTSLNEYAKRGIPEIGNLIEEFYQGPIENSWLTLHQLLEGIEWIYETIKSIDATKHNISGWDDFITGAATFEAELPNLLEAIENRDNILIADIIQYEILPQFQMITDKTEQNFE